MDLIDDARSMVTDTAGNAADFAHQSADALMKAFDAHGSEIANAVPKAAGKKRTMVPLSVLVVIALAAFVGWRARRGSSDPQRDRI